MKNLLAAFIVLLSALTGAGLAFHEQVYTEATEYLNSTRNDHSHDHSSHSQGEFQFGTAHDHALLYIIVNGTELKFQEPQYQLAADYVHLESNRSHIVHKHAKGVKWTDFFDTINASVNQSEQLCLDVKNVSRCGNGTIWLNGERNASLEQEIMQDDRLVIVLGGNVSETLSHYYSKQLPRAYSPEESRGRRL